MEALILIQKLDERADFDTLHTLTRNELKTLLRHVKNLEEVMAELLRSLNERREQECGAV